MRIAVFTSGRQDWGILAPVVRELIASPRVSVRLIASGMHCRDGNRPQVLDGVPVDLVLPILPAGDDDHAVAYAAGETTRGVAAALHQLDAEALLLLGDRSETLAAGLAATCLRLPIIHLHGGEETAGAIDNACRHALSQLARLHAVAHPAFRQRLIGMGIPGDHIVVSGAPAIDAMLTTALPSHDEVARHLGVARLGQPLVLLTHHPTTLGGLDPLQEITEVIGGVTQALASHPTAQVVMTRANADAGGMAINAALAAVAARDRRFVLTGDLGAPRYWSLLSVAQVMVGNSSSGILEAPSFDLPVINIGDRQHGRLRVHDVCDVPTNRDAIAEAVSSRLLSPRAAAPPHASAYGDGHARARIRAAIEDLVDTLATKRQSKDKP